MLAKRFFCRKLSDWNWEETGWSMRWINRFLYSNLKTLFLNIWAHQESSRWKCFLGVYATLLQMWSLRCMEITTSIDTHYYYFYIWVFWTCTVDETFGNYTNLHNLAKERKYCSTQEVDIVCVCLTNSKFSWHF